MTLHVKPIGLDSIPPFALREMDALECYAGGMTPEIAVRRSVAGATNAFAHYHEDTLLCLWGFRMDDPITRSVSMWLLSTEAVELHRIAFGRASKKFLAVALENFTSIEIIVYNDYTLAIKWLEWLGFTKVRGLTNKFSIMQRTN